MNEQRTKNYNIIIAAGGSGGHIFPAIALADELEKVGAGNIYFVASKRRLDMNILKDVKHECFHLSVNPMPRSLNPLKIIKFIYNLVVDSVFSLSVIFKVRPDVVVGFGGYSSGAMLLSAKITGVPILIHEQNMYPGRANILLSRIAEKIAVSFDSTGVYLKCSTDRIVFTGNPLRNDILTNDRTDSCGKLGLDPGRPGMLVMGGSQGSAFLNDTASRAAQIIKEQDNSSFHVIHLSGKKDYERVKEFYEKHGIEAKVFSFLDRIEDAYAASDLAISRSGAAAIFELAYYAKPMILVPYPNPKNNQRSNAKYFSDRNAAVYREEKDLTAEDLAREVSGFLFDENKRKEASRAAGSLSVPDAAKRLAGAVLELVDSRQATDHGPQTT